MTAEVAIVVPYFQRQPGVLRGTVQKVFAQRNAPTFELIIVDDGSPVPVDGELAGLEPPPHARITLVRQANAGIAGACNAGLAAVPPTATWIARLDSDDHWDPDHLATAVKALRQGYDFFFANEQGGEPVPRFAVQGFSPEDHTLLDDAEQIYAIRGDFLPIMLRHGQFCSSTVVMRRSRFADLRYRPTYNLCEDMHLFLDVALASPRVAFSPKVHVTHGPGIHFNQINDWKSDRSLRVAMDYFDYYRRLVRDSIPAGDQAAAIQAKYKQATDDVATILLAMVKSGRMPEWRVVSGFLAAGPAVIGNLATVLAARLFRSQELTPSKAG
ncbi:MAG: glycosyltransferase family 2 protein [Acetobacteraceae bacterium]|nr:glycosyltransferase family 2 protein [Pseudomonadota bacterium]